MTLLELLVQELPKRGGWPQWAAAAVQDGDHEVKFAGIGSWNVRYTVDNMWRGTWGDMNFFVTRMKARFTASTLASDHATRIVTREEYEQAVKPTQFEQSVKAANELARALIADAVRQLTDAVTVQSDDDVTPLQRIEQLRKARDEAVRAYNDAFVSGEAELRKLKLGDKVMFRADKNPSTLVETKIEGDIHCITGHKWVFRDDCTGESRYVLTDLVNPISFQFVKL